MSLTDILPLFKTSPWKGFPSLKGHEEGYFWTCVTPFLREIGNTGLKIGKFTSPRALKLPFQEKQFLEVISALYFLQLSMPHLEPALLKLRPEFIEVWPCNALYYLSLNTITWAHLVMAAKTLVVQRQTDSVPDPEKGGKMARVAPVVNQLAFDSSRQVAYVFHRLRTLGKKLASFMALGFIMTQIPIIAHELVQGEIERIPKKAYEPLPSLPGVTDHPPPEACQFTAERKLMELEWMLEGVRNCTYAHGDDALRETVAYLTFELEKLKKEQDTFLATSFLIGSQQSSPEDEYSPPMCGDENLKLCRGDSGDFNNTSVKEMVPADFSAAEELHRLQQTLLALQQSGQLDADLLRNANLSSQFLNLPPPRHDGAIG
ncbi:hypothetical protein BT69DRAFT_917872 [Atractiella rhizophila]|nr:hypothetical protein BT69DRAFT_917872 [Atractiella rhizophila]